MVLISPSNGGTQNYQQQTNQDDNVNSQDHVHCFETGY